MADLTTLLSKFLGSLALFSGSASGVLTTNTTTAGTAADTNETDLWTYSLPANALSVNGQMVRITAYGNFAANANTKTIRAYFGSTVVKSSASATNGNGWRYTWDVIRTGAATQLAMASVIDRGAIFADTAVTPAETLSGAVTIKLTGQNGSISANDIVFKGAVVELLN